MKNYKEIFIEKTEVSEIDLDPPFWEPDADEPNNIEYWLEEIPSTLKSEVRELREMLSYIQEKLEDGDTPEVWKIEELLNKKP